MYRPTTLLSLAVVAAMTASANATITNLAYNDYNTSVDGWTVRDTVNGNVSYFTPAWNASGGVPDGHLEFSDVTPGGYVFEASQDFTGDFTAALNIGGVSFDWKANQVQAGKRASVIFWRDNVRLWASSNPDPAANIWHSFDFTFTMNFAWQIDYGTGAQLATMADLGYVLGGVTGMDITGETWTGMSETTWLDNPRIYMRVPAPGALALLGIGAIAGVRRRRVA